MTLLTQQMINNLYPTIQQLSKSDKIRLLQFLATEIAKDEELDSQTEEQQFWVNVSQPSLQQIWGHPDEEVYNELL
ncbi:hypothetical protein [Geminocystis sp. NIES-3708]|uniref:hypothetical protein n=1 Tax=Geminocystis sp. NIES-3708 TaxID=1615909 RepID=UPI0008346194|nr:hypothetical protein [Geminocystis sp. NIES-3708]